MADESAFEIGLFSGGSNEAGYHNENITEDEIQRRYLIQRGSDLLVKGRLVDVIHGTLKPGGTPATLIVTKFNFLGSTASRRFRWAKITWEFYDAGQKEGYDPQVETISLDGQFSMNEKEVEQSTTVSGNTAVQGGAFGASVSLGGAWERTQSLSKVDRITLVGSSIFGRGNSGEPNGAMWILNENKSQGDGIPDTITTAVLLKRKPNRRFVGTVQVKARVDLSYALFGKKSKDDPVNFDPQWKSTSEKYSTQSLGDVDLDKVIGVKFNTPFPTAA